MTTATATDRLYSPEEFYELEDSVAWELCDGRLEPREVSRKSSLYGSRALVRLSAFAEPQALGSVYGPDLGLRIFAGRPRRIPRADVVYVSRARLDESSAPDSAFLEVVPELAVEVMSPTNRAADIDRKVTEYLGAGMALVWVIYPETRHALVYRADGSTQLVPPGGSLDGEDVIPGFTLPLSVVFGPDDGADPSPTSAG